MQMPFGRHEGRDIGDLPDSYLRWLMSIEMRQPLLAEVEYEWHERRRAHERQSRRQTAGQLVATVDPDKWRRRMAARFHPDHGGRTRDMQIVNEGHRLLCEMTEGATR